MTDKTVDAPVKPEGFQSVGGSGFPSSHDFDTNPVLVGEVTKMRDVIVKYGKENTSTRILEVRPGSGPTVSVWQSAALVTLFDDVAVGDHVWISYTGEIKLKGKRNPMKGFECAIQRGLSLEAAAPAVEKHARR